MTTPSKLLFLPGASGNTEFWRPAAERLAHPAQQVHIGWPGFSTCRPGLSEIPCLGRLIVVYNATKWS